MKAFLQMIAQAPAGPPLQPLPHPELPEPVLVPGPVPVWIYLLAGLIIMAMIGLVLWLLLRPKKAVIAAPAHPWQVALNALRALQEQAATRPPVETAAGVSDVLRRYFMDRYRIPAPFRTTKEIFHGPPLTKASTRLQRYQPLAELWDELSFAPVPADGAEAVALVEKAATYLQEDRP